MKPELEQYKVESENFWEVMQAIGITGYDAIEFAHDKRGWQAMPNWGRDGYDLGQWPYIIIFWRNLKDGRRQVAEYCEGDVVVYTCPSDEIRQQVTDELAFWHWKFQDREWVASYETVDDLPAELRGPYRAA